MGIFGWSLPPGCGELPGERSEACEIVLHSGRKVYWDEDGNVFTGNDKDGYTKTTVIDWDDDLDEEANYERVRQHFTADDAEIARIENLITNSESKPPDPVPTIEDFVATLAPANGGDFNYETDGIGDWTPYYSQSTDTWGKETDALRIKRTSGHVELTYYKIDSDGNWDLYSTWETDDSVKAWEDFYRMYNNSDNHFRQWARYHLWCAENGGDPLKEFVDEKRGQNPKEHLKAAADFAKYLTKGPNHD